MSRAPRLGHWLVAVEGMPVFATDECTLDECERAEAISGTPYTVLNPQARARDAKAYVFLAWLRGGVPEAEALTRLTTLTHGDVTGSVFTWVPPEDTSGGDGDELPPS